MHTSGWSLTLESVGVSLECVHKSLGVLGAVFGLISDIIIDYRFLILVMFNSAIHASTMLGPRTCVAKRLIFCIFHQDHLVVNISTVTLIDKVRAKSHAHLTLSAVPVCQRRKVHTQSQVFRA